MMIGPLRGFLLVCLTGSPVLAQGISDRVLLCPDPPRPANTWMSRTGNNVSIGCTKSWKLHCEGMVWLGVIGDCPMSSTEFNEVTTEWPTWVHSSDTSQDTEFNEVTTEWPTWVPGSDTSQDTVFPATDADTLERNLTALWQMVRHLSSNRPQVQIILHTEDDHADHDSHEHTEGQQDNDAHVHVHLHVDHGNHHHAHHTEGEGHQHGGSGMEGQGHQHGGHRMEGGAAPEGHDQTDLFHHNPLTLPEALANEYVNTSCYMQANHLPRSQRQNIRGTIYLRQMRHGGPVEAKFNLQGFGQRNHEGQVNHQHAFHVHEYGDLSDSCYSIGEPYNPHHPEGHTHHGAGATEGDLGVIECNSNGHMRFTKEYPGITLVGPHTVLGRSLSIHATGGSHDHNEGDHSSAENVILACCNIGFSGNGGWDD